MLGKHNVLRPVYMDKLKRESLAEAFDFDDGPSPTLQKRSFESNYAKIFVTTKKAGKHSRIKAFQQDKYCDRQLKLVVVVFRCHVVCDRFGALRLPVNEAIRLPCALLFKKKKVKSLNSFKKHTSSLHYTLKKTHFLQLKS